MSLASFSMCYGTVVKVIFWPEPSSINGKAWAGERILGDLVIEMDTNLYKDVLLHYCTPKMQPKKL